LNGVRWTGQGFIEEVGGCPSVDQVGRAFSVEGILRFDSSKAFDEKGAID
jgi:hypothetical protein